MFYKNHVIFFHSDFMCHQANIISSHVNADAEQKTKGEEHSIGLRG